MKEMRLKLAVSDLDILRPSIDWLITVYHSFWLFLAYLQKTVKKPLFISYLTVATPFFNGYIVSNDQYRGKIPISLKKGQWTVRNESLPFFLLGYSMIVDLLLYFQDLSSIISNDYLEVHQKMDLSSSVMLYDDNWHIRSN